jgi:hypothetical protein
VTAAPNSPLQPGQSYYWEIYQSLTKEPFTIPFQVMSAEERDPVEAKLQGGKASFLQRAKAFARLQLWSDFWSEILAIEQPSAEMTQLIEETFVDQCPDP